MNTPPHRLVAGLLVLLSLAASSSVAASADVPAAGANDFHAAVLGALSRRGGPEWFAGPVLWTRRPDARDVWASYPDAARRSGIEGRVDIVCRVNERGELNPCEVLKEDPAAWGFGIGGLQLSRIFRMRVTADQVGRLIVIPIAYRRPL